MGNGQVKTYGAEMMGACAPPESYRHVGQAVASESMSVSNQIDRLWCAANALQSEADMIREKTNGPIPVDANTAIKVTPTVLGSLCGLAESLENTVMQLRASRAVLERQFGNMQIE
jgi:hypothetical protein